MKPAGEAAPTRSNIDPSTIDPATNNDRPPPERIGAYRVIATLGEGGCGTVYEVVHPETQARAAAKVLKPHLCQRKKDVERFLREARAITSIQHPGIVQINEVGFLDSGPPYFLMELLKGQSLSKVLAEKGRFSVEAAMEILGPVCDALEAAHRAGIVHRDVKASNIFVCAPPAGTAIKLLDFGIAKDLSDGTRSLQTTVGRALGSPHAMAPEQITGTTLDARTDVYGLGVLIYRLLTGRYPFAAKEPNLLLAMHLNANPSPPSMLAPLSTAVDRVVLRCLAKRPEDRFGSARELLVALREAASDPTVASQCLERVLGAHLEFRLGLEDDEHGERADEIADAVECASQELQGLGFAIELETFSSVLSTKLLPESLEAQLLERNSLFLAIRGLAERLQARVPETALILRLHEAPGEVSRGPLGPRVVKSEVLDPGSWPTPHETTSGVFYSRSALWGPPIAMAIEGLSAEDADGSRTATAVLAANSRPPNGPRPSQV